MSTLGYQLLPTNSLAEGAVWAAGRSLPEMSLAFALMAAINSSTGSRATLSHGLYYRTNPRRPQSGGQGDSHSSPVTAQEPSGTLSRKARALWSANNVAIGRCERYANFGNPPLISVG